MIRGKQQCQITIARSKMRTERKSWDLGTRKDLVERRHHSFKGKTKARLPGGNDLVGSWSESKRNEEVTLKGRVLKGKQNGKTRLQGGTA